MRSFRVNIAGKQYLVEVEDIGRSPVHVRVNGQAYEVAVEWEGAHSEATVTPEVVPGYTSLESLAPAVERLPQPPTPRISETEREAATEIVAPMPGTIIAVAVIGGETVERGEEVCVLEAMKMRNSIRSPRVGRIAEVLVSAGSKVAYGDVLMRFDDRKP